MPTNRRHFSKRGFPYIFLKIKELYCGDGTDGAKRTEWKGMMITIMVRRGGMVVMDTVRPSIRASWGIWAGAKTVNKKLWNSCKKIGNPERLGGPPPSLGVRSYTHTHLISEEHWECRAVKVQVINAVLKKHMKIVREAIFHAPVKGNNLRICCTPEIPNSENSLARYLAFLCVLRKLMISCEILSWLEIVYLTFTSSSKFLRLTNFHQSLISLVIIYDPDNSKKIAQ